jgi:fatty acid desaturase
MTTQLFKDAKGWAYHVGAFVYAITAYAIGMMGLFSSSWIINALSTLLLAHGMAIAAYLIHECGHNTIFKNNDHNSQLGRFLNWLCGSCYGTYEDIRYKHFRHHVDNDDVVWFEYEKWFSSHPITLKVVKVFEWFYIPAHDLLMHVIMMFSAFIIPERKAQRIRNLRVIIIRFSLFCLIAYVNPKAAILYATAYMIMMTVLRFMDSLQHDYGYHATLFNSEEAAPHKRDTVYEQTHTFSNPLCFNYTLPNWLVLNFGFHNAHHANPTMPWYRLPALHRELFGDDAKNIIPFSAQLRAFHRFRVVRVNSDGSENEGQDFLSNAQQGNVLGGNAASFLTSF